MQLIKRLFQLAGYAFLLFLFIIAVGLLIQSDESKVYKGFVIALIVLITFGVIAWKKRKKLDAPIVITEAGTNIILIVICVIMVPIFIYVFSYVILILDHFGIENYGMFTLALICVLVIPAAAFRNRLFPDRSDNVRGPAMTLAKKLSDDLTEMTKGDGTKKYPKLLGTLLFFASIIYLLIICLFGMGTLTTITIAVPVLLVGLTTFFKSRF